MSTRSRWSRRASTLVFPCGIRIVGPVAIRFANPWTSASPIPIAFDSLNSGRSVRHRSRIRRTSCLSWGSNQDRRTAPTLPIRPRSSWTFPNPWIAKGRLANPRVVSAFSQGIIGP